ncbi:BCCT family transporter [Endozoicomonas sp. ONNA2]|uniref:BCCT family transporter n=1 Tax=Endozoicomonas sp. ONNA2 TaxID=2828741 RepID=UPI0021479A28|nr:BCCT family transporter [Endozoicomonas sp. ONNA2]
MNSQKLATGIFVNTNPVMSIGSTVIIIAFVLFTIIAPVYANGIYEAAKRFIATDLAWYYVILMSFFLLLAIYTAFSHFGHIKLGHDDEKPDYSFFSWFSMLFGAGIGIGILFWSIAEPIHHFQSNPFITQGQEKTLEAAQIAMRVSIFHWGLHGWAIFAITGMAIAYFSYRKGLPLSIRSGLYPAFGDKIYGPIGHMADLLAVFGTVFGIATSLGLGAQQMNAGMNYLFGFKINSGNQVVIITIISLLATLSALRGLNNGLHKLSILNMRLTVLMLTFFIVLGPTAYLLGAFATNLGDYITNAVVLGFWVDPNPQSQWQGWWTLFYWGWWIAWAPFVGMFIARISKGRTIKEFILGVLIAPTLLATFWITAFGNTAIFIELFGSGGIAEAVNKDITTALFVTMELMDLGAIIATIGAIICTVMSVTYFITSADSATLVICTLVTMGQQKSPPKLRIFWSLLIGAVAGVLLIVGGLKALQTASIIAALPYSIVLAITTWGLYKSLREELNYSLPYLATPEDAPLPSGYGQNYVHKRNK